MKWLKQWRIYAKWRPYKAQIYHNNLDIRYKYNVYESQTMKKNVSKRKIYIYFVFKTSSI